MPTSLRIEQDLKDRIESLAQSRDRSPHWIMLEAIQQYVEREEKRESFYREAAESWEEYQNTGLHLTGDELSAWLKTWGGDEQVPAPKCHE